MTPQTPVSFLERLMDSPGAPSWSLLVQTYSPLIRTCLANNRIPAADVDDLVQDVLHAVVRDLPGFQHNNQRGAFRAWLRSITVNRVRNYWRSLQARPDQGSGRTPQEALAELEDPANELQRLWDEEHDRFIAQRLLALIEPEFEPRTWQAFQRVVCEGETPAAVAADLGITVNAVFIAKSRVLSRLRQEGRGLID